MVGLVCDIIVDKGNAENGNDLERNERVAFVVDVT